MHKRDTGMNQYTSYEGGHENCVTEYVTVCPEEGYGGFFLLNLI